MNRKTAEVARRKQHEKSTWTVAGMSVRAGNVYEALFVEDPRGRYRQCAVYSVLEDSWYRDRGEGQDDLESQWDFYLHACNSFSDPEDVELLLEEIEPLVGTVELRATSCQRCGDVIDVDDLAFNPCCDALLCRDCRLMSDGEHCGVCGCDPSPVEVLALLADD